MYTTNVRSTENVKGIYNTPIKADKSKSLESVREIAKETKTRVTQLEQKAKEEVEKARAEYSYTRATEEIQKINNNLANEVKASKEMLQSKAEEVINAKREALTDYISKTPTQEQLNLLTALNLRSSITPEEITAVMPKMIDSYQALKTLHDIAERTGTSFIMPIEPAEKLADLNKAEGYIKEQISNIQKTDYRTLEFYGNYEISLLKDLDEDRATITELPKVTLLQRLTEAKNKAMAEEDYKTAIKISKAIEDNADILEDPEEAKARRLEGLEVTYLGE